MTRTAERAEPLVEVESVGLTYATKAGGVAALDDVTFKVHDREIVVLVGSSGCGKSTLLRIIAGLIAPTAGHVLLNRREVVEPDADRGMVFQGYTLFPWLTVSRNVQFGSRVRGLSKTDRNRLANHFINLVGLRGFEDSYPATLSGGMQQRVALARALANEPAILLMDEPFGALDAQTRSAMQQLLLGIWETTQKTILFVTHDVDEALFLGDRILVMARRPGRILREFSVDIPRPRAREIFRDTAYIELKSRILTLLEDRDSFGSADRPSVDAR